MSHRLLIASASFLVLSGCAYFQFDTEAETRLDPAPAAMGEPGPAPDNVVDALAPYYAQLDVAHPRAPATRPEPSLDSVLTRIAFGSCHRPDRDMAILDVIVDEEPDIFIYGGDNVYGDVWSWNADLPELRDAYQQLADSPEFGRLRATTPMLAIWDDHDYGMNDLGRNFPYKGFAETLFLDFWGADEDDVRRSRPGIYDSRIYGPDGQRTQIILLDTRYFRSDLTQTPERGAAGMERYIPSQADDQDMLGDAQWAWLEEQFRQPADLRLLVSTIQVHADGHGWEAWRTLPRERQRLYDLIDSTDAEGVILVSGDRHSSGLYVRDDVIDYPLYEITSSSLNMSFADENNEAGPHRIGEMYAPVNYGVVGVDWEQGVVSLEIKDGEGQTVRDVTVSLSALTVE